MQGIENEAHRLGALPKETFQAIAHRLEVLRSAEANLEKVVLLNESPEQVKPTIEVQLQQKPASNSPKEIQPSLPTEPEAKPKPAQTPIEPLEAELDQVRQAIDEIFEGSND